MRIIAGEARGRTIDSPPGNHTRPTLDRVRENLFNMIQTKADKKGLDVKLDFDDKIPKLLYGDEVRIEQIMINILNNAVKYTDTGSVSFDVD